MKITIDAPIVLVYEGKTFKIMPGDYTIADINKLLDPWFKVEIMEDS